MPPVPFTITGNVTINSTNQQGVYIYVWNKNRDSLSQAWINNVINVRTNSSGNYILDLANISPSYANADTIYVFAYYDDISAFSTFTVDTVAGTQAVNFTWTRNSRLTPGVLGVGNSASTTAGLRRGLNNSLQDGLK